MQNAHADQFQILGQHVIAEYYGCDAAILDDLDGLAERMVAAARHSGATPVKQEFHHFAPHGISGVVIIMESHLTIHTWPEHRYAAVDFFTCGKTTSPLKAHEFLVKELGASSSHHVTFERGIERRPLVEGNLWRARLAAGCELRAIRSAPPAGDAAPGLWLSDDQGDQVSALRVSRVLHAGRTTFAQVEIVDTDAFGRVLSLDGMVQSSSSDEAAYHESLVAPAFVLAQKPLQRVAILGGGEGATLREVLRFPEVKRCVMVDLDPELVALCRTHLADWSGGAFDDPRAEVIFDDALRFLERAAAAGETYDLIVCDLPEAEISSPLVGLYSRPFFELVRRCLSPSGLYVGQIGSLQTGPAVLAPPAVMPALAASFEGVRAYARFIPSYGGEWVFAVGTVGAETPALTPAEIDQRLARRRAPAWPCRAYDGVTHQRLFSLALDVRNELSGARAGSPR